MIYNAFLQANCRVIQTNERSNFASPFVPEHECALDELKVIRKKGTYIEIK